MTPHRLRCLGCGRSSEPSLDLRCGACAGLFRVEYLEPPTRNAPRLPWQPLSLGEGDTPIVEVAIAGGVIAKLEFLAPTGSFKDRGAAILIGAARHFGVEQFVEDSSGNAGAALAAYGAAADMRAHIFLPASAPPAKCAQIEAVGGIAHPVDGPRDAASRAAHDFADQRGFPFLSHNLSPYFAEGMKAVAWELTAQLAQLGGAPEQIVLPVGNGSLLLGLQRGFAELREAGGTTPTPRLHAAQSTGVAPLVAAFQGRTVPPAAPTVADGIAVAAPPRLEEMVAAIRQSDGSAIAVAEGAILEAQRELGRFGLWCEPTSAVALVAVQQLRRAGLIAPDDRVVVPLTGSGLKQAAAT